MKIKSIFVMTICCLATACSSMEKSMLLGAGLGGAAGSAIGNNHGQGSSKNRVNGAAIGVALGGLFGYLAHKGKKKKTVADGGSKEEENTPLLTRPRVKRIWVKDQIKGKRFVRGHWEYIIEENSSWSR